ncbi:MAG: hypothetical protein Q8K60_01285 [Parachlamydiaceae bacterium]|nr:hypothetical protein [Parachlamydiaceae bacterium]
MPILTKYQWMIAIISMLALMLSFFIFMSESQELLRSLFAAFLVAILVFFSMVIIQWIIKVFTS